MNEIDRIGALDYVPKTEDILRTRIQTTGVVQMEFQVDGMPFL